MKYDEIIERLSAGGSYNHEIIKLLCEMIELLEKSIEMQLKVRLIPEKIIEKTFEEIKNETEIPIEPKEAAKPVKKRGRPPKKRR